MDAQLSFSYAYRPSAIADPDVTAHPRPYYYLENFSVALDWLRARYHDLLSGEERQFIHDFEQLPTASAALAVRMIMRQGDLFRSTKLNYEEIGCPRRAAMPLVQLGWLDPAPQIDFLSLFRVLRKAELCAAFGLQQSLRKLEILELLAQMAGQSRTLKEWWPNSPDEIFQVRVHALCERLKFMFFGNYHQSWSEFVLADLGIFRYERIAIDHAARAFQSRRQIEDFHAIYRCREMLEEETPLEEVLANMPGACDAAWIETKRAKLLFAIAYLYERAGELAKALEVYRASTHREARVRSIRVLKKLQRSDEAAAVLALAQQNPTSEWEIQHCARISQRATRARRQGWETLDLELPAPNPPQRVELVVSEHLGTPESPVLYVENTLLNAIFGLLCWDAIFAPLPGAFFHAFHSGPADLNEPDFYQRRTALFAQCFAQLETGTYRDTILKAFEIKSGIQTPFVAWQWLTREQLELALDCIPAAHLSAFFQRLLTDLKANRSGLPDLIQLWPGERRYQLIEVKGPGDRLQDNQIRWLSYFVTRDIPVCVCKVAWATVQA
jgi:hypothetical protein